MPSGSILHISLTNLHLQTAKKQNTAEQYKKAYRLKKENIGRIFSKKVRKTGHQQKKDKAERATGQGRRRKI